MATALDPGPRSASSSDQPRAITAPVTAGDMIFRGLLRCAGLAVLAITAMILVFLVLRAATAVRTIGLRLLSTTSDLPGTNLPGIGVLLPYSVLVALIALAIAIPAGVTTALYISECAPRALRRPLIAVIDLMAAIPSIVFALWGLFFVMPRILGFDSWLARYLGFIPIFNFQKPNFPSNFANSVFIAGVVVSLMVIPIITSLSRQVFSQAPQGEREAAYALGSTRWGMIRTVVLPFGRAGVIGASMLGLGRALGETIAVSFILSQVATFNTHVLESGGNTVTSEIANQLLSQGSLGISVLFAAGLALFLLTLATNSLAAIVISRSRSGAVTDA
jgi:phosphate transport system permease protein